VPGALEPQLFWRPRYLQELRQPFFTPQFTNFHYVQYTICIYVRYTFHSENVDLIKAGAKKKRIEVDIDRLLAVDDQRKLLRQELDAKKAEQNRRSNEIQMLKDAERGKVIEQMQHLKKWYGRARGAAEGGDGGVATADAHRAEHSGYLCTDGESDADNVEVKKWGTPTEFAFTPKDHVELMTKLDIADFERGTKVAGFRGYFLKGDGVLLENAVWQLALKHFSAKGMTLMGVPSLVRRDVFLGTGYLPQGEEDLYKTQDGDYLAGTAEVATMGYYMNEVLDEKNFPVRFLAFSPCFRREAGAHGKDVRGLIRVHEFFKWEQVVLCKAEHDESVKTHEWLNRNTEEFIELLQIPYHTVANCGGTSASAR